MSEMTEQEQVKVRVTRVVADAVYDATLYNWFALMIIGILLAFSVWPWIIGLVVLLNWFSAEYFKDKAVKKAVDKLI